MKLYYFRNLLCEDFTMLDVFVKSNLLKGVKKKVIKEITGISNRIYYIKKEEGLESIPYLSVEEDAVRKHGWRTALCLSLFSWKGQFLKEDFKLWFGLNDWSYYRYKKILENIGGEDMKTIEEAKKQHMQNREQRKEKRKEDKSNNTDVRIAYQQALSKYGYKEPAIMLSDLQKVKAVGEAYKKIGVSKDIVFEMIDLFVGNWKDFYMYKKLNYKFPHLKYLPAVHNIIYDDMIATGQDDNSIKRIAL